MYLIAETIPNARIEGTQWSPCKAKTLRAAKAIAQRARMFQGTCVHVAIRNKSGEFVLLATRYPRGHAQEGWNDFE